MKNMPNRQFLSSSLSHVTDTHITAWDTSTEHIVMSQYVLQSYSKANMKIWYMTFGIVYRKFNIILLLVVLSINYKEIIVK